jgi:KUP system potassium uptake protein
VYPLIALATVAAVIASQALISGAFSLTRQAVQLGYSPRVGIEHTSARQRGQIYIPQLNWMLMIATIALVIGFKTSSALAAAYGVAVTATMVITTLLTYQIARRSWGVPPLLAGSIASFFLVLECSYLASNLTKITHGGWFPLVVGAVIYTTLSTWKKGRALLASRLRERLYPFESFLHDITERPPLRVPGMAVFMTSNLYGTPPTLLHNLQHNKVLHEKVLLLTVVTADVPYVKPADRVRVEPLGQGFYRLALTFGFMEEPNVPQALTSAADQGLDIDIANTTFFVSIETLLSTARPGLARWRERLFVLMSRNATRATAFFRIPSERVVELGMQLEL